MLVSRAQASHAEPSHEMTIRSCLALCIAFFLSVPHLFAVYAMSFTARGSRSPSWPFLSPLDSSIYIFISPIQALPSRFKKHGRSGRIAGASGGLCFDSSPTTFVNNLGGGFTQLSLSRSSLCHHSVCQPEHRLPKPAIGLRTIKTVPFPFTELSHLPQHTGA